LGAPLVSDEAVVRELASPDAQMLAEAGPQVTVVRGRLGAPTSMEDAIAMLAEWEGLREGGQGNLFGVFTPGEQSLAGVVSLRLSDDFVAEGACWNVHDQTRRVLAKGIVMITNAAHQRMEIMRVWVAVDPLDPFAKYLSMMSGFRFEGQVQQPDGHVMDQYSSIA
jgi:hypothetical protein